MLHEKDNISVILKTTATLFLQQTLINNSHQNHTSRVHYCSQLSGRIVISSGVQNCSITFFLKVRSVVKDTWSVSCCLLTSAEVTNMDGRGDHTETQEVSFQGGQALPQQLPQVPVFHRSSPEAIRQRCCGKTTSSARGLQSSSFFSNQEFSSTRQWFCFLSALKQAKMLHL